MWPFYQLENIPILLCVKQYLDSMGFIFNVPRKELLAIRKNMFLEKALPELEKQGFKRSPFNNSWFGWNGGTGCHIFELGRISSGSLFEYLQVYIFRDDRWIQIYLNIFKLSPEIGSIEQLKGSSGMQFCLPPNSLTQMRLREDGCGKITLFKELFSPHYKLGGSLSFRRFKHKVGKLEKLILNDMRNIDRFITQWHSIYQTNSRDWNGNEISLEDK